MRKAVDRIMLALAAAAVVAAIVLLTSCAARNSDPWPEKDCSGIFDCSGWDEHQEAR